MPGSIPPTCRPPRSDPAQHGLKLTTANQERRTKTTLFNRRIKNLGSVQLLLGHTKIVSAMRHLGIQVEDAFEMATLTGNLDR